MAEMKELAMAMAHDLGVHEVMLSNVQTAIRSALVQTQGPVTVEIQARVTQHLRSVLDMIEDLSVLLEVPTLH